MSTTNPARKYISSALTSVGLKCSMEILQGIFRDKFYINNFYFYQRKRMSVNRHEVKQLCIMMGFCSYLADKKGRFLLAEDTRQTKFPCLTPLGHGYHWTFLFRVCIFWVSCLLTRIWACLWNKSFSRLPSHGCTAISSETVKHDIMSLF
jgi:hypothetical protein